MANLEGPGTNLDSSESLDVDQELQGEGRQHSSDHGALEAGVVTLEERPGEEQTLGAAARRVAEWREAGRRAATANNRVERAEAEVKRLELELRLVERFHLTLPPDREPWDEATRERAGRPQVLGLAAGQGGVEEGRSGTILERIFHLWAVEEIAHLDESLNASFDHGEFKISRSVLAAWRWFTETTAESFIPGSVT